MQLKPLKWLKVPKQNGEGEEDRPIEALMILKYGGVLTHAGRKQVCTFKFTLLLYLLMSNFLIIHWSYSFTNVIYNYHSNRCLRGILHWQLFCLFLFTSGRTKTFVKPGKNASPSD